MKSSWARTAVPRDGDQGTQQDEAVDSLRIASLFPFAPNTGPRGPYRSPRSLPIPCLKKKKKKKNSFSPAIGVSLRREARKTRPVSSARSPPMSMCAASSEADWHALYRAWLESIVLVVRGQNLAMPGLPGLLAALRAPEAASRPQDAPCTGIPSSR